jgi:hypothetical protein
LELAKTASAANMSQSSVHTQKLVLCSSQFFFIDRNLLSFGFLFPDPSLVPIVTTLQQAIISLQSVLLQWSYPVPDASFVVEGHFSNKWIVQGVTTNTSLVVARERNLDQYRVSATSWCGESPPAVFSILNGDWSQPGHCTSLSTLWVFFFTAASSLAPVSNVTVTRFSPCSKWAKLQWSNTENSEENVAFQVDVLEPGTEWMTITDNLTVTTLQYNLQKNGEYRFRVKRIQSFDSITSQPAIVIKNFSNTGNLKTLVV